MRGPSEAVHRMTRFARSGYKPLPTDTEADMRIKLNRGVLYMLDVAHDLMQVGKERGLVKTQEYPFHRNCLDPFLDRQIGTVQLQELMLSDVNANSEENLNREYNARLILWKYGYAFIWEADMETVRKGDGLEFHKTMTHVLFIGRSNPENLPPNIAYFQHNGEHIMHNGKRYLEAATAVFEVYKQGNVGDLLSAVTHKKSRNQIKKPTIHDIQPALLEICNLHELF